MRWCISLLLFSFASAQTFQITEISPHKMGDTEEWFEFRVSEEVDLSVYQVSNGKNKPKALIEAIPGSITDEGHYFYYEKSPVSLANNGGVLQVLDSEGLVLTEASYSETKKGQTKDYAWAEIWNWDDASQRFTPLIYRNDGDPQFAHTRGQPNRSLPSQGFRLLISEVGPDHDFIEFYVVSGPDEINLRGLSFKHNGTTLRHFIEDYEVTLGDFLLLRLDDEGAHGLLTRNEIHSARRSGVSGGSGTVEVIAHTGTSLEERLDFLCWRHGDLSKTESVRVEKMRVSGDWEGDCPDLTDFPQFASLARDLDNNDNNHMLDWSVHYHGSPAQANETINQPPQAIITLQGSKKLVGVGHLYVNVTGEKSLDPDGNHDLANFKWTLNGKFLTDKPNPAGFRIEDSGEHVLELTVTDYSGETHSVKQTFIVVPPGSAPSANQKKAILEQVTAHQTVTLAKESPIDPIETFFAPVLANVAFMDRLSSLIETPEEVVIIPNHPRRITLPLIVRQRLSRNLGLIWDWRLQPWAAGVGSTSDGAIDQNSERFVVAFGAP